MSAPAAALPVAAAPLDEVLEAALPPAPEAPEPPAVALELVVEEMKLVEFPFTARV